MLVATAFNIHPEMPSGPLDLETSIDSNRCRTSSSVCNRLSMESGVVSGGNVIIIMRVWNIQMWEGRIEPVREKCVQHVSFV